MTKKRPVRLSARTSPFHGGKTGSIPVPGTNEILAQQGFHSSKKKSRATSRADHKSMLEEFRNSKFFIMHTPTHYKPAKLYNAKGDITKEWYVEFYVINPETGKFHRFKERFEINRMPTKGARTDYGRAIVQFLNEKLKNGFNPFIDRAKAKFGDQYHVQAQLYKIAVELCEEGTITSRAAFREHYNRFCKFIQIKEWVSLLMEHITIDHAKEYRAYMRKEGLSRKTINASLSYMAKFWAIGVDKNWTPINPFISVPRIKKHQVLETEKDTRFEPLNSKEMTAVFEGLSAMGERNFIRYLSMIYYAWARPSEIARLRVNDIDFERDVIRFRKTETKNGNAAYVQIVPPLKTMLLEMELQNCDGNHYLFGMGFTPGLKKLRKNIPSEHWRSKVKDDLGIKKDMYALKHTGNIEYLLRNKGKVDLKWQQSQNRHSSSVMTERYIRKLGAYFIELKDMNFRIF